MFKKTIIVVAMLVVAGLCVAGWDNVPVPTPAKDIIDMLAQVPSDVVKQYGSTEKVRVVHDILLLKAEIRKILMEQNNRISALEAKVEELGATIAALTSGPTGLDLAVPYTGGATITPELEAETDDGECPFGFTPEECQKAPLHEH